MTLHNSSIKPFQLHKKWFKQCGSTMDFSGQRSNWETQSNFYYCANFYYCGKLLVITEETTREPIAIVVITIYWVDSTVDVNPAFARIRHRPVSPPGFDAEDRSGDTDRSEDRSDDGSEDSGLYLKFWIWREDRRFRRLRTLLQVFYVTRRLCRAEDGS
jgi:hypothetical protein